MVREEHFYFASSEGTAKCHGVRWIPEGQIKAVVQLVHGMAEYIERYREFAQYLAERGVLVTGHVIWGTEAQWKIRQITGILQERTATLHDRGHSSSAEIYETENMYADADGTERVPVYSVWAQHGFFFDETVFVCKRE